MNSRSDRASQRVGVKIARAGCRTLPFRCISCVPEKTLMSLASAPTSQNKLIRGGQHRGLVEANFTFAKIIGDPLREPNAYSFHQLPKPSGQNENEGWGLRWICFAK